MMRPRDINDDDADTDTGEITDSEGSTSTGEDTPQLFPLSFYKLSYKRLPRKCIKSSFLMLNGATFLAGLTAVIISIWMLTDSKLMSRFLGQRIYVTVLLIIGIFACFITAIGLLGFVKRRRKFLTVYIVFHALFLFFIFASSILSFSLFDKLVECIRDDMVDSIENYRYLDWVTEAWDNTHRYLKCCGIDSQEDWTKYGMHVPQSCCATTVDKCLNMSSDVAYKSGCLTSAINLLRSSVHTVAVSTIFISIILFANLFFALAVRSRVEVCSSSSKERSYDET